MLSTHPTHPICPFISPARTPYSTPGIEYRLHTRCDLSVSASHKHTGLCLVLVQRSCSTFGLIRLPNLWPASSPIQGVMEDPSADNTKENTSIVDSSLTDGKDGLENCDDPEITFYNDDQECYVSSEGEHIRPTEDMESFSRTRNKKICATRYFIMKSLSHQNIQLSIKKGIWATQVMNEPILDQAFHNSACVILIFSVNMSGYFQGYAQMMSSVGWRRESVWSESSDGSKPWGRTFKVKWLRLHNLPFQKTLHLKNPLNGYKPVKISRDCQELSQDVGEALCGLFDVNGDIDGKLKRSGGSRNDFILKKPCRESPVCLQDEDSVPSIPSPNIRWVGASTLYPSLPRQHVEQPEANGHHVTLERSSMISFPENLPSDFNVQKSSQVKPPHNRENLTNEQGDRDAFPQSDKDVPHERTSAVSLSEEDFLDMTYEEYLQYVSRSTKSSTYVAAGGPSRAILAPPVEREQDDDPYSKYLADWHRSQNCLNSHHQSFQ